MKSTGRAQEFLINTTEENPHPNDVTEDAWQLVVRRFQHSLLTSHSKITIAQAKVLRAALIVVHDALAVAPTTNGPSNREYSAAQHRGWIANIIYASITPEVRTTLDAHDEDHEVD